MSRFDPNPPSEGPPRVHEGEGTGGAPPDEFAGIPAPRRSRAAVLALCSIGLAAFLTFRTRADLSYALSSATPVALGDARSWATRPPSALPVNRLVRISGLPDRESAVILDTRGSWSFSQFFRLLGTGSRVLVRRVDDPLPVERASRDDFTGRLVRLDDVSFDDAIRSHFATHVTSTHFFRARDLAAKLAEAKAPAPASHDLALVDTTGEQVTLSPTDELVVDVTRPGEVRVDVPVRKFPTPAEAEQTLRDHGAQVLGTVAGTGEAGWHQITVAWKETASRDDAFAALERLNRGIRVRPARTSHAVRLRDLRPAASGLALGPGEGAAVVPFEQIAAVRSAAGVSIPKDAVMLLEGDRPRDHLHAIGIVAVLLAFGAVSLLALRRTS